MPHKTVNISPEAQALLSALLAHYRQAYEIEISQAKALEAALRTYAIQLGLARRNASGKLIIQYPPRVRLHHASEAAQAVS